MTGVRVVAVMLVLFVSVESFAEEAEEAVECVERDETVDLTTSMESFGLHVGYGGAGIHFSMKFFTFRWERFYLTSFRTSSAMGTRDASYLIDFTTEGGYPLRLSSRDEIRLGAIVGFGHYGIYEWGNDWGTGVIGGLKAAYAHKFFEHFTVEIGAETRFFIWSCDDYPVPDVWGYLGISI